MSNQMDDKIVFKESLPDIRDYWDLSQASDWNQTFNYLVKDLTVEIQKSFYSISLYDSNKLIGFGRVITDSELHSFTLDFVIHPDYQGRGLGWKLLDRLISKLMQKECKSEREETIKLETNEN